MSGRGCRGDGIRELVTPHVFTCTPKRSSASVLSPSVTAT